MKVCVLASGSSGNAAWVRAGKSALLIDAGISFRALKERLAAVGENLGHLTGVVVTHEHGDHVAGLAMLVKKTGVPIYATAGTAQAAAAKLGLNGFACFAPGDALPLGPFTVRSFAVSHDAAEPVGVVVETGSARMGLATDLGLVTRLVEQRLSGCGVLVLEANHDPQMLLDGPYPWEIKQRIRGRFGHLPNSRAAELLGRLHHADLDHVFLAHRSRENNTPELQLAAAEAAVGGTGTKIHITWQERPSGLIEA